jgi:zinc finger SWIM domain-containing protein 3
MYKARQHRDKVIERIGGHMVYLSNRFAQYERDEPGWVKETWHNDQHRLGRLFWMNPSQRNLAQVYGEVIQLDTCQNRNAYGFYLTTFVVVNGDNKTRNIAYCLTDSEDTAAFEWMMEHLKTVIEAAEYGTTVKVVFSDRSLAIAAAVRWVFPEAFHGICLWHLQENLLKNLGPILGNDFKAFLQQFWETYRMGSPATFERAWQELLLHWHRAVPYLQEYIYPDKEKWGWAWVGSRFAAGMKTTGRVENEHRVYKILELGATSTLNEVVEKLCDRSTNQQDLDWEEKLEVPAL